MRPDELDRMLNTEKQRQDRPLSDQSRTRLEQTYAKLQDMDMPAAQPEQTTEQVPVQTMDSTLESRTDQPADRITDTDRSQRVGKRATANRWWYTGIGAAAAVLIFASGWGGSTGWSLGNVPVLGSWIQPEHTPTDPEQNIPTPNPAAAAPEINQTITHGKESVTLTRAALIGGDMQIEYKANRLDVLEKVSLESIRYEGREHANSIMTLGNPVKQTGVFEAKDVKLPDTLPDNAWIELQLSTAGAGVKASADPNDPHRFIFRIPAGQIGKGKVMQVEETHSAKPTGHTLALDKVLYTPLMVSVELSSAYRPEANNDQWLGFEAEDDQGHAWKSIGGGELNEKGDRIQYQVSFMDGEITPSARTITIKPYYDDATAGQRKFLPDLNFTIPATQ
ncbi:DUF5643 domain-containing protein [Paenibacillus bovis]|uniref:DUF5643 domain-containing protein n=1 Tax=Paenibacillus bovis TaxID=1616788 RepID=A0A172ZBP7_9BACL|nr:DUF5643 domain-containing protein [Paenibacillus bovis]ANF94687.1 hypothetical protein AR543_00670 [Paenibacillus bovis]